MSELEKIAPGTFQTMEWSRDQERLDLLRRTLCEKATPDEFALFIAQCQHTGLDPIRKQAYCVPRWDSDSKSMKMVFQVGIDGLRKIAQSTGLYAGQTAVEWCGQDGKWTDAWLVDEPPAAARVSVYRKDFPHPLPATVHYREFVQRKRDGQPMANWASMPAHMLGKSAEAAALRKAFPDDLSGIYTDDEPIENATSLSTEFGQATVTLGVDASPEDRVRAAFTALSPEQRQAFPEALHAWCGLDVKGMKVSALIDSLVDTLSPDDYARLDVIVEAYWESIEPIDAVLDPIEGQVEIDA